MDLVHRLDTRTPGPASGDSLIVMVQPTQDRKSDHLVPCVLSAKNRSVQFRDLLLDPLMRPCPIEVGHIAIEQALELFLLKDQQVVQACLPHTSQESLTDGIGSRCLIRCCEHLDATCRRHPSKARPKFAIVIS